MISLEEISRRMRELKGWGIEREAIVKEFMFSNFKESMEFVNKVAEIAERENHHPDIVVSYGNVKLSLSTHSEKSISEKDFEVAKEIDKIYG